MKPMLATLVDKPFQRDGWIYEIKWDGYRAVAEVSPKGVSLYSRNQNPFEPPSRCKVRTSSAPNA